MSGGILDALCRELADAGVGAYSTDSALPAGQVPIAAGASPPHGHTAVTLATYPGPPVDSRNGWEYPRLQVRVRGGDSLEAVDLDRLCFDALQFTPDGNRPRSVANGYWLQDCHARDSAPQLLGVDDNGRHEYVRNYQLTCWVE